MVQSRGTTPTLKHNRPWFLGSGTTGDGISGEEGNRTPICALRTRRPPIERPPHAGHLQVSGIWQLANVFTCLPAILLGTLLDASRKCRRHSPCGASTGGILNERGKRCPANPAAAMHNSGAHWHTGHRLFSAAQKGTSSRNLPDDFPAPIFPRRQAFGCDWAPGRACNLGTPRVAAFLTDRR